MNRFTLLFAITFILTLLNIMPQPVKKKSKQEVLINLLYNRNSIARLPSYAHYRITKKVKLQ